MKRWVATVVVALVLVGGGVAWAATRSATASSHYLTATVTRGTVAQTVAATGSVAAQGVLSLDFGGGSAGAASSSGSGAGGSGATGGSATAGSSRTVTSGSTDVTAVSATVGQQVVAGQVLARVDATAADAELSQADTQLDNARARQADEPAGTAQSTLDADAAAIAQAEQQVVTAQAAVAATTLVAPTGGVITAVNISAGLPPTSPAITMRSATLAVTAEVSEDDITQLAAGQTATVTFPALSTSATGTVGTLPTAASSSSTAGSAAVTYPVTISLPHPPAHLLPGMTAQVAIVISSERDVLEVPTAALQGSSTAPTVQLLVDGKPTTQAVEIGLTTNATTEIVAGLSAGQVVVTGVVNPVTGATTSTTGGFGGGGGLGGTGGFGGFRTGGGGFRTGGSGG